MSKREWTWRDHPGNWIQTGTELVPWLMTWLRAHPESQVKGFVEGVMSMARTRKQLTDKQLGALFRILGPDNGAALARTIPDEQALELLPYVRKIHYAGAQAKDCVYAQDATLFRSTDPAKVTCRSCVRAILEADTHQKAEEQYNDPSMG